MNAAQAATVERLRRKGWRGSESDMFRLAVPMYRDRPLRFGRWPNTPDPCVVHVRRDGRVHRGYPLPALPAHEWDEPSGQQFPDAPDWDYKPQETPF